VKRLVLLLALALPTCAEEPAPLAPRAGTAEIFRQFADILDCLQKNYVEPSRLQPRQQAHAAFREFIRALDPQAEYLTPTEATARREPLAATNGTPVTMLRASTGYCRLGAFTAPAVDSLADSLPRLRTLVLDIRDNPGGDLHAALEAARLFLPPRAEIVTLEYADVNHQTTFAGDAGGAKFDRALVVLVNAGTASEAEVFAAALQENQRARLVGNRTAGRGRLVSLFPLPDGAALRLPTATYLTPSRQRLHGVGLTPDVTVEATAAEPAQDPAVAAALRLLAK
jgi:C-terminal processing protease CtpA/Prc